MRSVRLPSAPPRTIDSAMTVSQSRAWCTARTRKIDRPIARIASTTVAFVNRLNAPPLFRVRLIWTSSPMMASGLSERVATTQDFVSWSRTRIPTTIVGASQRGGAAGGLAPGPLDTLLAVDAELGPRDGLEPGHVDLAARRHAQAVGAVVHPLQRPVDLVDGLARVGGEHEVTLALHGDHVALAGLLVELRVALLPLVHEHVGVGLELDGLLEVAGPLLDEEVAQLLQRLRREVGGLL